MTMTTTTMAWRRDPELPHQRLEEETIVVDPASRQVHLLNETAGRVWELCASPRSLEELVAALVEEYDAPAEEVRAAVTELLADLGEKRILVRA
jgi:PqqD family protein of HPr-rel-A system